MKHAQKRARLSLAASRLFSASAAAKSSVKPLANLQAFEQAVITGSSIFLVLWALKLIDLQVNSSKGAIVDFRKLLCFLFAFGRLLTLLCHTQDAESVSSWCLQCV